jgi:hypothetical protein
MKLDNMPWQIIDDILALSPCQVEFLKPRKDVLGFSISPWARSSLRTAAAILLASPCVGANDQRALLFANRSNVQIAVQIDMVKTKVTIWRERQPPFLVGSNAPTKVKYRGSRLPIRCLSCPSTGAHLFQRQNLQRFNAAFPVCPGFGSGSTPSAITKLYKSGTHGPSRYSVFSRFRPYLTCPFPASLN